MTSAPDGPRLYIAALGCPKNQVDSERMAGIAADLGLRLTGEPLELADIDARPHDHQAVIRQLQLMPDPLCHRVGRTDNPVSHPGRGAIH